MEGGDSIATRFAPPTTSDVKKKISPEQKSLQLMPEAQRLEQEPRFKVWRTVLDDRTRDSHVAANGQVRFVGEPFNVGDTALIEPRDADGLPEEIYNCRCFKEEFTLSDLPKELLSQVMGRLTEGQRQFLNEPFRVVQAGNEISFTGRLKEKTGEELAKELQALDHRLINTSVIGELSLFEALNHYFLESGKSLTVSIEDPAKGIIINQNPDVKNAIRKLRGKVGVFPLLINKFVVNTNLVHGKVTFKFQGKISVDKVGWQINGDLRAYSDKFDFNPQKFGERNVFLELGVRAFKVTEGTVGKIFEINFDGAKTIQENGIW